MKPGSCCHTGSSDISGICRNLRLVKYNIQHICFSLYFSGSILPFSLSVLCIYSLLFLPLQKRHIYVLFYILISCFRKCHVFSSVWLSFMTFLILFIFFGKYSGIAFILIPFMAFPVFVFARKQTFIFPGTSPGKFCKLIFRRTFQISAVFSAVQ